MDTKVRNEEAEETMKKRTLWIAALAGLLALGLAAPALAADVAQAVRARLGCDETAGEPVTVEGTVAEQSWNQLELLAGETTYTVRTGPFKAGLNLPDLDGQAVTVEGYAGKGINCNADAADDVIRARTITYSGGTIDLTQAPAGGFGQWRNGSCNGECARDGDGNVNRARAGRAGGNGGNGIGCSGVNRPR